MVFSPVSHGLHHSLFPFSEHLFFLLLVGRWFSQTNFQVRTAELSPVESLHGVHGLSAVLEVDKCVVLDLFDSLYFAVGFEDLAQLFLADHGRQITDVENFDLCHRLFVGLLLRIGPVDNYITAPDLDAPGLQPALGQTRRLMRLILQKAKATVFLLVVGRAIDDDLLEAG